MSTDFSESSAWLTYRGSDAQRIHHAFIVSEIERARTELETVSVDSLKERQGVISGLRKVLTMIHEHDTPDIQKTYGTTR